jgi:hypothetical protein
MIPVLHNIIGMGTTDGMDPIHACHEDGYFHYKPGIVNVTGLEN